MSDSHTTLTDCISEMKAEVASLKEAINADQQKVSNIEGDIQRLTHQANSVRNRIDKNTERLNTTRRMLAEAAQGYEQIMASTSTLIQIIKQKRDNK